jgi:hypothetical protein
MRTIKSISIRKFIEISDLIKDETSIHDRMKVFQIVTGCDIEEIRIIPAEILDTMWNEFVHNCFDLGDGSVDNIITIDGKSYGLINVKGLTVGEMADIDVLKNQVSTNELAEQNNQQPSISSSTIPIIKRANKIFKGKLKKSITNNKLSMGMPTDNSLTRKVYGEAFIRSSPGNGSLPELIFSIVFKLISSPVTLLPFFAKLTARGTPILPIPMIVIFKIQYSFHYYHFL